MRFHKLEESLIEQGVLGIEFKDALQLLRRSQKFYAGNIKRLPFLGVPLDSLKFPRLPFPITAVEFEIQVEDAPDGFQSAIVLAVESFECGTIVICPFARSEKVNEYWWPLGKISVERRLGFKYVDSALAKTPNDVIKKNAITSMVCLEAFLNVLNCVNVRTETVSAPYSLNKKRSAGGKPPIYEYKTLVLKRAQERILAGGGTHEAPRIHLRRGHIKHRKTGDFWWQPCVVGDRKRGIVMKSYRADKLMSSASEASHG